jgi:hypothetical protein
MIISLKQQKLEAWLNPAGKSPQELDALLADREAPYYEHEVMAA